MIKFLVLIFAISTYATPLIHIAEDSTAQNLFILSKKYAQNLLVNNGNVYLIPKECQIERYFGGISEGDIQTIEVPVRTEKLVITQEVFEAKSSKVIEEKIRQEKIVSLVEGKVSKAFLDDNEGRSFGGASEVELDLSYQKNAVIRDIIHAQVEDKASVALLHVEVKIPSCRLLEDGSGYMLYSTVSPQFYESNHLSNIVETTVMFK